MKFGITKITRPRFFCWVCLLTGALFAALTMVPQTFQHVA